MKPKAFVYERGGSLENVSARLQEDGVRVIAGGQSLGPMLNLRLAQPEVLIDISSLPQLRGYQVNDNGIIVGAGVTHAEIEDGLLPDTCRGILPSVARGIAYRAVRRRGTVGGSLAHADPAADWASCLSALGAQVILQGQSGALRRMALTDFLQGAFKTALEPGELLIAIFIPRVSPGSRFGYFKLCRKTGELAHAIGAVYYNPETGERRAVFGALSGNPLTLLGPNAFEPDCWAEALQHVPGLDQTDNSVRIQVLQRALDRSSTL